MLARWISAANGVDRKQITNGGPPTTAMPVMPPH